MPAVVFLRSLLRCCNLAFGRDNVHCLSPFKLVFCSISQLPLTRLYLGAAFFGVKPVIPFFGCIS